MIMKAIPVTCTGHHITYYRFKYFVVVLIIFLSYFRMSDDIAYPISECPTTLMNMCVCQCGKDFKYKRNLRTHESGHSGTMPFVCCGKGFASS